MQPRPDASLHSRLRLFFSFITTDIITTRFGPVISRILWLILPFVSIFYLSIYREALRPTRARFCLNFTNCRASTVDRQSVNIDTNNSFYPVKFFFVCKESNRIFWRNSAFFWRRSNCNSAHPISCFGAPFFVFVFSSPAICSLITSGNRP